MSNDREDSRSGSVACSIHLCVPGSGERRAETSLSCHADRERLRPGEGSHVSEQPNVIADLVAEGNEIDRLVCDLDVSQWALATPAAGWTIAHQIAHLAATFRLAALAAADPERF